MGRTVQIILAVGAFVLATCGVAQAHTYGAYGAGLPEGFWHPLGGVDHVLAMAAVGLWAARVGGRAVWGMPLAFLAMMVAGAALGIAGLPLPLVETGILASVIFLGAFVALGWRDPFAGLAVAGFFAVFHGHAHGAEMPQAASPLAYGLGFVLATGTIHALGAAAGLAVNAWSRASRLFLRAGGGAIALAGFLL